VFGRHAQGGLEVRKRALMIALEQARGAAADMGVDIGRVEPQRLVEVRDRGIEVAARQMREAAVFVRAAEPGFEPDGFGKIRNGAVELTGGMQRRAALAQHPRIVWRDLQGAREVGNCEIHLALRAPRNAAHCQQAGIARGKPDRTVEVDDGAVEVAGCLICAAARTQRRDKTRVELDGFVEIRNCAVVRPLPAPRIAPVEECLRVAAIETDRAGEIRDGAVKLALGEPAIGAIEVRDGEVLPALGA
jgi:hypothetical protein